MNDTETKQCVGVVAPGERCPNTATPYYMDGLCHKCRASVFRIKEQEREARQFADAEKIQPFEWEGPVWLPSDRYFASVDDLLDDFTPEEMPAYAWCCDTRPSFRIDIGSVIESAMSDAHPECEPRDALGLKELEAAIDAFNELNAGDDADKTWIPSTRKCVVFAADARRAKGGA